MFRAALPASLLFFLMQPVFAQDVKVPGLTPDAPKIKMPDCVNTQDANSCVRFLACVGEDGLWMDGQVRGWNYGSITGQRNDGAICVGQWAAGDGSFGSGTASYECADGSKGKVVYFSQDSVTGTTIARGMDDKGRIVRAWSGENVLKFLGKTDVDPAKLPCSAAPILIG